MTCVREADNDLDLSQCQSYCLLILVFSFSFYSWTCRPLEGIRFS